SGRRREADRVEGVTARLDPDLRQHRRAAVVFEGQPVRQRLRDRLDGEGLAGVTDLVDVAVGRREADRGPIRIRLAGPADVVRDLAAAEVAVPRVQTLEVRLDGERIAVMR